MADFFTRLAGRTLGTEPTAKPLVMSIYAPERTMLSAPAESVTGFEESSTEGPIGKDSGTDVPDTGITTQPRAQRRSRSRASELSDQSLSLDIARVAGRSTEARPGPAPRNAPVPPRETAGVQAGEQAASDSMLMQDETWQSFHVPVPGAPTRSNHSAPQTQRPSGKAPAHESEAATQQSAPAFRLVQTPVTSEQRLANQRTPGQAEQASLGREVMHHPVTVTQQTTAEQLLIRMTMPEQVDTPPQPPTRRAVTSDAVPIGVPRPIEAMPGLASGRQLEASPAPTIHVTIGRVEIRAIQPPPAAPVRRPAPPQPKLSLEAYLQAHNGGRP